MRTWRILVRGVRAKRCKTNRCKAMLWCTACKSRNFAMKFFSLISILHSKYDSLFSAPQNNFQNRVWVNHKLQSCETKTHLTHLFSQLGECFTTRFFLPLENGITVTVARDVEGLSTSTGSTAIRLNLRFLWTKNTYYITASVLYKEQKSTISPHDKEHIQNSGGYISLRKCSHRRLSEKWKYDIILDLRQMDCDTGSCLMTVCSVNDAEISSSAVI